MCAHKRVRPGIDETMRFSCILSSEIRFVGVQGTVLAGHQL